MPRIFFLFTLVLGTPVLLLAAAPNDVGSFAAQQERDLEGRLRQQLQVALGPSARISPLIRFVPKQVEEKKESAADVDLVYLPVPVSSDGTVNSAGASLQRVFRAEVTLFVAAGVPQSSVESAKTIAQSMLRGFSATVSVVAVQPVPEPPPAVPPPAEPKQTDELSPFLLPALLVALGLALMGILLFLAIRRAAEMMRDVSQNLNISSRQTIAIQTPKKEPEQDLSLPGAAKKLLSSGASSGLMVRDAAKNVRMAQQVLLEAPRLFVGTIAPEEDAAGIRWLLPRLSEEAQEIFRRVVPPLVLAAMTKPDQGERPEDEDVQWLQEFTERLVLQRMQGAARLDSLLGIERVMRLLRVPTEKILEAVRAAAGNEAPYAWRLAAELLRKEDFARELRGISEQQWSALATSHRIDLRYLPGYVDHLLQRIAPTASAETGREHEDFVTKQLLEPLLESLRAGSLTDAAAITRQVERFFPDLSDRLEAVSWTVATLHRVPAAVLQEAFRSVATEQRAPLLALLPEELAGILEQCIPKGAARTVAHDDAERLKTASPESTVRSQAESVVRGFLEKLRVKHASGSFLLSPRTIVAESRPERVLEADATVADEAERSVEEPERSNDEPEMSSDDDPRKVA